MWSVPDAIMLGRQKNTGGYEDNRVNRLERKGEEFCSERPGRALSI